MDTKKELIDLLFSRYGKVMLSPDETAEVTGRSKIMLQKDRMAGVGLGYVKVGKQKSARVYYPLINIIDFICIQDIKDNQCKTQTVK